jgi:hypothetical protein
MGCASSTSAPSRWGSGRAILTMREGSELRAPIRMNLHSPGCSHRWLRHPPSTALKAACFGLLASVGFARARCDGSF